MYLLLSFCVVLVLKSSNCRFVPKSEPFDLQRYASNPQAYEIDRSSLTKNFGAPENLQYYQKRTQRNIQDPVGIVYGNGKPIGFLQPYGRVYQMAPDELNNNQPTKREYVDIFYPVPNKEDNAEAIYNGDQTASKFNSEYPSVLTNFKIDSKLKNREPPPRRAYDKDYPAQVTKREAEAKGITKENVARLKNALQDFEQTPENKASVQEILSDMGFAEVTEGALQKRESSQEEDEDMEKGLNAIRLVKETHDVAKRKSKKQSKQKELKEEANESEKDSLAEDDYEEEDGEKTREKRDDTVPESENSELMKNLEKSGDLTVSGNKSPLASTGSDIPKDRKQKNEKDSESEEERVAREIQAKIDAIKDQVKRQIAEQKGERKKRDVNNLLHGENLEIDPQFNFEEETQTHHVRRKRHIEATTTENPHDRQKRENALNIPLIPYREDEDEMDEENDEFEDDGFDDRTAELVPGKRLYLHDPRVIDDLEWENSMLYDDQFVRKKRHDGEQHQRMFQHLGAVRERSEMPKDYPKVDEEGLKGAQEKLQQIADMSDSDLFGALPEGYEGELTRYKRVKRD